ncbi:MAG: Flp pilus assembly complex ATPase component TadA [Candidatus Marinimicrobia bacterium]|nr:Flp pilus assembly complex ATPase component TadA [Candidatus Neomarinimicrobiota bacterium]
MVLPAQKTTTSSSSEGTVTNLLSVLADQKALTLEQIEMLKVEQANTGQEIKDLILEHQYVSLGDLVRAEAQLYNLPLVNLEETAASPVALGKLPRAVAEHYQVFPFAYETNNNQLSLAMADPTDLQAIEFVEKKAKVKVKPFMATLEIIQKAIAISYEESLSTEVKAALKETAGPIEGAVDISRLGEIIREAPIAKIVSTLLEFAVKGRASDIHIEPEEEKTRIRYRIDGIMMEKLVLPKKVHEGLISRIKILSGMKIDEKRLPQDGRFSFKADGQEVDLRVSCLPTVHGEKIVMRLLKKGGGMLSLTELGLRGLALKHLQEAVLRPHGIIIVCGPTGSGKTTTLYSALAKINNPRVNIITLEDPVEYEILGVSQVQVNPAAGLTFASGLKSFVRQDPDIIMVGEIRDKETTNLAVQAALTGHLVFSTLHTNDASGAIPRLIDLGAEPFLLASSMTCIVAQRVVRKICSECKEEYLAPPEVIADLKKILGNLYQDGDKPKLYRGKKCSQCNNTGYLGRIGIFEVIPLTEKIGRLTMERAAADTIEKQAVEDGMMTMKQDGYLKALEGITTIEEVLRTAQE